MYSIGLLSVPLGTGSLSTEIGERLGLHIQSINVEELPENKNKWDILLMTINEGENLPICETIDPTSQNTV